MNQKTAVMPDVFTAVRDYVAEWATPALETERIFRGWRNKTVLPDDDEDFAVVTILADNRRGTNVSTFETNLATNDDGTLTRSKLVICDVLVEFYGSPEASRSRAVVIETAMRDEFAARFFNGYGIAPLYADETREVTPDEDSAKAVARYATTLHLNYWLHLSAQVGWFDTVNVNVLADVDTHYPTEE